MRVINCTGPEVDCRRIENLLLNNLVRQKLVRPDPLFLGLDTSEHGALVDADGEPSDFLYTIGPSRKGSLSGGSDSAHPVGRVVDFPVDARARVCLAGADRFFCCRKANLLRQAASSLQGLAQGVGVSGNL